MEKHSLIFYGAGSCAEASLPRWITMGLEPVCFVDSDKRKHHKKLVSGDYEVEILPLEEAMTLYPDYKIAITSTYTYFEIYNSLLEYGIPGERFLKYNEPKWCQLIGKRIVVEELAYKICCEKNAVRLPLNRDISETLEEYKNYCSQLNNALKEGLFTTCEDCHVLQSGYSDIITEVNELIISSGLLGSDICNFRCCYCYGGKGLKKTEHENNVYEILKSIDECVNLEAVDYAGGEITVSPLRHDILKLWKKKKWKGPINTNAAIYNQDIADLLNEKLITVQSSLDAGTKETFNQIKGVDCFDKVKETLTRYSSTGGKVFIKYIILKGINDNAAEIEGFIEFAAQIKADVVFSRDLNNYYDCMTKNEWDMMALFFSLCHEKGIACSVTENCFNKKDLQIMKKHGYI